MTLLLAFRRRWCGWRGHRWEARTMVCLRCRRTAEMIRRGIDFDPITAKRESDAYWRGVLDGRRIDRKRAYRLGYARGARSVFAHMEAKLLGR